MCMLFTGLYALCEVPGSAACARELVSMLSCLLAIKRCIILCFAGHSVLPSKSLFIAMVCMLAWLCPVVGATRGLDGQCYMEEKKL